MTIPLVDNNGKDSINTSVIAIKKEIEQIESLLQNARNKLKSLSDNDFLYRSDLTDTVTVGDNQPVTSNAVADKINSLDVPSVGGSGKYISEISETDGKICATATDLGNMEPVDAVTSGDMHSVTSNAVYSAIGGKGIKYKDITFTIADMTFNHVTANSRDFWYCNIPKSAYFTNNQKIINAVIVYWAGTPSIIVLLDADGDILTFQYWDNHFASNAAIKVRYLYIET